MRAIGLYFTTSSPCFTTDIVLLSTLPFNYYLECRVTFVMPCSFVYVPPTTQPKDNPLRDTLTRNSLVRCFIFKTLNLHARHNYVDNYDLTSLV